MKNTFFIILISVFIYGSCKKDHASELKQNYNGINNGKFQGALITHNYINKYNSPYGPDEYLNKYDTTNTILEFRHIKDSVFITINNQTFRYKYSSTKTYSDNYFDHNSNQFNYSMNNKITFNNTNGVEFTYSEGYSMKGCAGMKDINSKELSFVGNAIK